MENEVREMLIKELSKRIECDAQGFGRIKSFNEVVEIVDDTVVKFYCDCLKNLAFIAKNFITNASQIYRGDNIEAYQLKEELQALEYAIKLAEEKYND